MWKKIKVYFSLYVSELKNLFQTPLVSNTFTRRIFKTKGLVRNTSLPHMSRPAAASPYTIPFPRPPPYHRTASLTTVVLRLYTHVYESIIIIVCKIIIFRNATVEVLGIYYIILYVV